MNNAHRYIVVKGTAGLGNRLCAALSAILYARMTGRKLHVDWRDNSYSDGTFNAFPELFTARQRPLTHDIPETDSIFPWAWRGNLDLTCGQLRRRLSPERTTSPSALRATTINLARLDYPHEIVVFWSFTEKISFMRKHFPHRAPEFHRKPLAAVLRRLFEEELAPAPEVGALVERTMERADGRPMIGLHIRATDKRLAEEPLRKAFEQLRHTHPEAVPFVCTDHPEVQARLLARYPDAIVLPKVFGEPGKALHHGQLKPGERLQAAREALADLLLLSRCDYLVGDERSTFVYLARIFAGLPPGQALTRRVWGREHPRAGLLAWQAKKLLHLPTRTPGKRKP